MNSVGYTEETQIFFFDFSSRPPNFLFFFYSKLPLLQTARTQLPSHAFIFTFSPNSRNMKK